MEKRKEQRYTPEEIARWVQTHAAGRSVPARTVDAPRPEPLSLDVAQRNFDQAFLAVPFNIDSVYNGLTGVIDSVHAQADLGLVSDLAACEVRAIQAAAAARKNGLSGHAQIYLRMADQHSTENHPQRLEEAVR